MSAALESPYFPRLRLEPRRAPIMLVMRAILRCSLRITAAISFSATSIGASALMRFTVAVRIPLP